MSEEDTLIREESTVVRTVGGNEDGPVTPEVMGRYSIRSEYGRGGQSRVLLAFDEHIGREIALKELLPEPGPDGTPRTGSQAASFRFLREARITGQLDHPNIVSVYELGQHPDGAYYYTQKLVRGVTLKKVLTQARTPAERLKLLSHFADICHAVAYAHSRGVVHRDLKPDNVMVGQFGETVVLDWGLAKARGQKDLRAKEITEESQMMRSPDATVAGHALGTPSYMSPEQALGNLDEIDERSDVWSLGAILFEILTGRPPFEGETAFSVIRKVIEEPPPRVRRVLHDAPPELAAVADKCLSRDKSQRYASSEEVAKEIEAYQGGGNVRAYQYSSWELLRRFVQRHRALTAVSGLALLLLIAALLVIRDEASRARAALGESKHNLAQAYLEKAHSAERDFLWHKAEIFYAAARVQEDGPEARWGSVIEGADAAGVTRIAGPEGWVTTASWSPDRSSVAAGGMDGAVRILATETGRELWRFQGGQPIEAVAFSPDGKQLASRDAAGAIRLHARQSGALLAQAHCSRGHGGLAFHGALLLAGCPEGARWAGANGISRHLAQRVTRCGEDLLLSASDASVLLGDRVLRAPQGHHEIACGGNVLAVSAPDRTILVYDDSGRAPRPLAGHSDRITHVAVSPDGTRVASSSLDRTVRLWDAATGDPLAVLPRPVAALWVEFSPDGLQLAVGEQQNALLLWSVSREQRGVPGSFTDFAFLPDGGYVAAGSGGVIGRWSRAGKLVASMREGEPTIDLALRESLLAAVRSDGGVSLWDLTTNRLVKTTPEKARAALFTSRGLLLRRADGSMVLEGKTYPPPGGEVRDWALSGETVLAIVDGNLKRLDLGQGTWLSEPVLAATALAVSGGRMAAGTSGKIVLLDAGTLAPRGELKMEGAVAASMAISPDGKLLASSGLDGAVHLHELQGGREIAHLPVAGATAVTGLQFSPDGALLHLQAPGATSKLATVRFLRIGDPAKLAPPEDAMRDVLREHGVLLNDGEIEPAMPPLLAASGPRKLP